MAEAGEKRDPSSHRTPGQIRRMDNGYNKKKTGDRVKNNKARAIMMAAGKVKKGDKKDVHHKVPLDKGGSNEKSNLQVVAQSENRAWRKHGKQPKKSTA